MIDVSENPKMFQKKEICARIKQLWFLNGRQFRNGTGWGRVFTQAVSDGLENLCDWPGLFGRTKCEKWI